jgi:antitoxin component of MazEF toxin-antitoxin module
MIAVKARRQGNATVVTIPASIKVPKGAEYYIYLNDDQSLTLIPKIANFYETAERQRGDLPFEDLFAESGIGGREEL